MQNLNLFNLSEPKLNQLSSFNIDNLNKSNLTNWYNNLPLADPLTSGKSFLYLLQEFNNYILPLTERIYWLLEFNAKLNLLEESLVSSQIQPEARLLALELKLTLNQGYLYILQTSLAKRNKLTNNQLAQLLKKSIRGTSKQLNQIIYFAVLHELTYPKNIWLNFSLVYYLAKQASLHKECQTDYSQALVLSLIQPTNLLKQEITKAYYLFNQHKDCIKLVAATSKEANFALNPHQTMQADAINWLKKEDLTHRLNLGINTQSLVDALTNQSILKEDPRLAQHLIKYLSPPISRQASRHEVNSKLQVALGFKAAHSYLFAPLQTLKEPTKTISANPFLIKQIEKDPWGNYDANLGPEVIEDSTLLKAADTAKATSSWLELQDISATGYGAFWPNPLPANLHQGKLLAYKKINQVDWQLGFITRISPTAEGAFIGIEKLEKEFIALTAKPLINIETNLNFLPAFYLAANNQKPAQLLTPLLPFKEEQQVIIDLTSSKQRVELNKLIASPGSFNIFSLINLTKASS